MIVQDPVMVELAMTEDDLNSHAVTNACESLLTFRQLQTAKRFAEMWAKQLAAGYQLTETRLRQTIVYHPGEVYREN